MDNHHMHHAEHFSELIMLLPLIGAIVIYILAVYWSNLHYKQWPITRTPFLVLGVFCMAFAVVGPLANRAYTDFTVHMLCHLLLGMLAPLLIALSAPITLILRTLEVNLARRFSRLLKCWPIRIFSDPIVASVLNVGGLWILYTTDLFIAMHQSFLVYLFVHFHIFFAGYLFTISMIYIDPSPHRRSFIYRAIVLVIALAGHGILAKYIYAYPPPGVRIEQAEQAGMFMYYGGDAIDLILIFIFCLQWYRASIKQGIRKNEVFVE